MQSLTKKIVITIITGIIIIVFGAWGMGDLFSDGNKNIIAEIKDKKIYTKDYIESARNYVNRKNKTELTDVDHSLILNDLLAEKIYEKFAEDLGIIINDDALAYYIKSLENFKDSNGKFSRVEYEKFLQPGTAAPELAQEHLKKELFKNLVVKVFTNGVSSTDYHIKKIENEFLKQVNAEFYQVRNDEKISNEKIEKYFNQNKQKFSLGELREGEVAKLDNKTLGFEKENDQFYKSLAQNIYDLDNLKQHIHQALIIKKKYVEKDEFDFGIRKVLNYGHTFAHAIETIVENKITHGNATALGMNIANYYSYKKGLVSNKFFKLHFNFFYLFYEFDQIKNFKNISGKSIVEKFIHDKKMKSNGNIELILPISKKIKIKEVEIDSELENIIDEFLNLL